MFNFKSAKDYRKMRRRKVDKKNEVYFVPYGLDCDMRINTTTIIRLPFG